ncbi:hypothetical protein NDA16_004258 [Ustilago loliicola]|nr:hypothetical protein NDA16_004258 [Ustilago loliicola]
MVFYLSRCYDDLVPVDRFPQLSFSSNPMADPKPMTHGPASPFGEINETVIFVSTEDDDLSPAIVVTTSQRSSTIRIYAFTARPSAFEATATLLSAPRIHSTLSTAAANGKVSVADAHIMAPTERDDYQQGSANGLRNLPDTPAASMAPNSTALGRGLPTNVRRSARIDLDRRSSGLATAGMGRDPSGRSRRISAMHSGTADRRSTGRKDDQASQGRDRTLGNISHTADGLRLQSQAYQHDAMMEELGAAGTSMRITINPASAARIRRSSQAAARTPYGGPRTSNRAASSAIKNRPSMNLSRLDTSMDTGRLTSGMVTGAGDGVRADAIDADNGLIEDDNIDLVRIADMDSFARSFASVCLLDEIKVPNVTFNSEAASMNPPSGKSAEFYSIVQRAEVVLNASLQRSSLCTASARHMPALLVRTLPEDAPLDAICAQLFSRDFRLRDVVAMLRTDTINSVYVAEGENQTEASITEQHNAAVAAIGERTKALSPGRAMLFMTARSFSPTQKWRISSLCLAVKVRPRGTTIEPDTKADTAGLDWPEFHNGVASVLELNLTRGMHVDSKWIFAHLGEQVTARHAGFLYGLGLMKQLPTLTPVHVFRYLKMRNNLLTIGFLLGMAVSTVGTADPTARHLIGMQLTAFLPPGSAPLNLSTITQTAGLLAMGLVFLGSNHRWTAKRMLDQIGAQESPVPNIQPQHREAYSLSAGLALGLVYLGKGRGDGMKSLPDKRIIARLAHLIKGSGDGNDDTSLSSKVSATHGVKEAHEINLTSAPAALAFGLIYLRSNNKMIADVMAPPQAPKDLDMLRPDVLFAHVLARSLILWDSTQPTREWLDSILPEWMQKRIKTGKPLSEAAQLAKINMQAGACFAIGLQYAGSKDQKALDCLWMQLDALERQIRVQTVSFFSKIRKAAVRAALDQVRISLAMVLAGSGDVDLLRHLRRAHGDVDAATCYGSHMATHMALGLLFLGGGRFTLGTSDLGVAALLISFLPPFPRSSGDNRAHLQAFRHLWYLAIEPRLLVATDVDTNQLVSLPVKIAAAAENSGTTDSAFTPLLLPNQRLLGPIESATARYWPASIDNPVRQA